MKRIIEFGYFQNVPAIMVKDNDGELSKAFLIDESSTFAVKQFIAYIARLNYIGTKTEFKIPNEEEVI